MDKEKEIRAILSGRTYFQNGAYMAADRLTKINFQGISSGSFAVSFFGVNHLTRRYQAKEPEIAAESAIKIFSRLGRPVRFVSAPEEMACLVRPPFGNPSVMCLEQTEEGLLLNVYTARTPLAALSRMRAIAAFEKNLPQELRSGLEAENVAVPKAEKKSRKARKAQRKAAKWEKKARKAEKRTEQAKAEAEKNSSNADSQPDKEETSDT